MRSDRPPPAELDAIVHEEVARVLADREGRPTELSAASRLGADLGLSSLDVAALVVRIEERLGGSGPSAVPVSDLRTFGDLCSSIGGSSSVAATRTAADDPLMRARARAEARRRTRKSGQ